MEEHLSIENVFGKPPSSILKWGISLITIFLALCLAVAAFIKYPDKVALSGSISSENPPLTLLSKTGGIIDSIYCKDKAEIMEGNPIMAVHSTLEKKDLERLFSFCKRFLSIRQASDYLKINCPENLRLGAISERYTVLLQRFQQFQHLLKDNSVFVKMNSLQAEIAQSDRLGSSLTKQEQLYEKDLSLTKKEYLRNKSLENDGAISQTDKEKAESKWINDNRQLENFRSNKINNDIHRQQLLTQINDLKSQRAKDVSTLQLEIRQLIDDIKGASIEWEEKHLVKSPVGGIVTFTKFWKAKNFIREGDTIGAILPKTEGLPFVAKGSLPVKASGTVAIGQKAMVEIEDFPSAQFGTLQGTISDISLFSAGNSYLVTITLPEDLKTNYQKQLPRKQGMKANILVYTKEYSLLERLFQDVLKAIKKNQS